MRILIQNCKNLLYYAPDGTWTSEAVRALDFESSARALQFCHEHRPPDVQIVLKFAEGTYDMDFPVSDECRKEKPGRATK